MLCFLSTRWRPDTCSHWILLVCVCEGFVSKELSHFMEICLSVLLRTINAKMSVDLFTASYVFCHLRVTESNNCTHALTHIFISMASGTRKSSSNVWEVVSSGLRYCVFDNQPSHMCFPFPCLALRILHIPLLVDFFFIRTLYMSMPIWSQYSCYWQIQLLFNLVFSCDALRTFPRPEEQLWLKSMSFLFPTQVGPIKYIIPSTLSF